jgi:hypothetical protein
MARKPNQNSTSSTTLSAADKRARAVTARRMGLSFKQIADQIGMSKSAAYKAVQKALTDLNAQIDSEALLLRAQEMDRLDALQAARWPDAIKGNGPACNDILRIMERRAKLCGLDAPIKTAQTHPDGTGLTAQDTMSDEERRARIKVLEGRRNADLKASGVSVLEPRRNDAEHP